LLNEHPGVTDGTVVDTLANKLSGGGLTPRNGHPVSLLSKIAFMCRSDIYPPSDAYARIVLKREGYLYGEESYSSFKLAFDRAYQAHRENVKTAGDSWAPRGFAIWYRLDPAL